MPLLVWKPKESFDLYGLPHNVRYTFRKHYHIVTLNISYSNLISYTRVFTTHKATHYTFKRSAVLHNNYLRMRMRSAYIIYTMAKGCVVGVRLMELNIESR